MKLTVEKVRAMKPCPTYTDERLRELLNGGVSLAVAAKLDIPIRDKIWAGTWLLTKDGKRRFALACAMHVEKLSTDPRVKACNRVTKKYLEGKATEADLAAASAAAWAAAWDAASAAAWDAAWAAARDAASAAAGAAASAAAWDAAWAAAWDAAWAAAGAAAKDAAWDAEREWQLKTLLRLLRSEGK